MFCHSMSLFFLAFKLAGSSWQVRHSFCFFSMLLELLVFSKKSCFLQDTVSSWDQDPDVPSGLSGNNSDPGLRSENSLTRRWGCFFFSKENNGKHHVLLFKTTKKTSDSYRMGTVFAHGLFAAFLGSTPRARANTGVSTKTGWIFSVLEGLPKSTWTCCFWSHPFSANSVMTQRKTDHHAKSG